MREWRCSPIPRSSQCVDVVVIIVIVQRIESQGMLQHAQPSLETVEAAVTRRADGFNQTELAFRVQNVGLDGRHGLLRLWKWLGLLESLLCVRRLLLLLLLKRPVAMCSSVWCAAHVG